MKKLARFSIICFVAILFLALYSILPLSQLTDGPGRSVSLKFDTPDEMINYTFASNFAEKSSLYYIDLVNVYLPESIVFPRWARPQGGFVYPGTFWGLIILFGSVAKIIGKDAIPFLTPLAAIGCIGLLYGVVKKALNRDVARWSALILGLFPVFVYYASRTMFHTMLFMFFLLLGIYCYLKTFDETDSQVSSIKYQVSGNTLLQRVMFMIHNTKYVILYYLSALSFGLAVFVRFADVVLVLLTMLALVIWKRADGKRVFLFFCFFVLSLIPLFILNHISYGNPLDFGHNGGNVIGVADGVVAEGSTVQKLFSFVLPFGFHPRVMWNIVLNVLLKPYWFFWVIGLLGYALVVKTCWQRHKKNLILFSCYVLCVSCYVISMYGSWRFSDSVVVDIFPISSSYYRYFLPLFVFVIPFVGHALSFLFGWFKNYVPRFTLHVSHLGVIGILLFLLFQYGYVGNEGLFHVRRQVLSYRQVAFEAKRVTNQEDIILVRRGEDKMVFPDRYHVVNIDYIPRETVERALRSFKGVVWEIRAGKFVKVK